jgi:hypothetical protein
MALRSHVDPCQFLRTVYAPPGTISETTAQNLAEAGPADRDRLFQSWRQQFTSNPGLSFHETYHYWQGLRLPFLYWYALDTSRKMFLGFREFARTGQHWSKWDELWPIIPELFLLEVANRCLNLGEKGFAIQRETESIPIGATDSASISILDLLEGATSFAEWQVLTKSLDDAVSYLAFDRWCKRNPSYTSAYRFTANAIGKHVAARCFLQLVAAAFETNRPVLAFTNLLALLKGNLRSPGFQSILDRPEPIGWGNFFEHLLSQLPFEAEKDAEFGPRPDQPFFRLSLDWVEGSFSGSGFGHPFLSPLARKWKQKAKDDPRYGQVLTLFRWVSGDVFQDCWQTFQPPITLARFDTPGGASRVITIDAFNDGYDLQGLELADILALFSIFKKTTGAFIVDGQRLCYHSPCPHFERNFCNSYPAIPIEFSKCGFPTRADTLIEIMSGR